MIMLSVLGNFRSIFASYNSRKTNKPNQTMKQEQRYNIFRRTHKGLRSMLFDAGAKIQQTDFTKSKQANAAIEAIKLSTRSFLYHLSKRIRSFIIQWFCMRLI